MNPFDSYMLNKVRRLILLRDFVGYGGRRFAATGDGAVLR